MNKLSPREVSLAAVAGIGSYTATEAGALIGVAPRSISRWLKGYTSGRRRMEPLWRPQWEPVDDRIELGFRDLVELRFVKAFLDAGVGLAAIRACLEQARLLVEDDRPFSTRRFKTDGKTVLLATVEENALLDLKRRQYVFASVIERTFKDLDIEGDAVVRWRPYKGREFDRHRSTARLWPAGRRGFGGASGRSRRRGRGRGIDRPRRAPLRGSIRSRPRRHRLSGQAAQGGVKVVVDENLPPALARALFALFAGEHEIVHLRERFGPRVTDVAWISELSAGRWVVISGDRRIGETGPSIRRFGPRTWSASFCRPACRRRRSRNRWNRSSFSGP